MSRHLGLYYSLSTCLLSFMLGCSQLNPLPLSQKQQDEPILPTASAELPSRHAAAACLATAKELETHGKDQQAIEQYERARQFQSNIPGVAARLAVLYSMQDQPAYAHQEFQTALREDPKNATLWSDFGYFQFEQQDFKGAEQSLVRATKLMPNHQRAWINLGLVLGAQQRYQESFQAFAQVVPEAAAYSNMGIILAQQGQLKQAEQAFAQAAELDGSLKQPQVMLTHFEQQSAGAAHILPVSAQSEIENAVY